VDPAFPRLHLVTDARPGRDALSVVLAAVSVAPPGALAVQVRVEDELTDRQAYEFALAVLGICRPNEVLCLVNDRLHVALAMGADGGHVGADDLPVAAARKVLGRLGVLGATCRDAPAARAAVAAGASYLGVGPAHPSTTKDGLPEPLGPAGVGSVAQAVPGTPVIAIGGITVDRAGPLREAGAHGVAVVGALANAADPGLATTELLKAVGA
jgi:thiamine-phosphate pyrophosphorylase